MLCGYTRRATLNTKEKNRSKTPRLLSYVLLSYVTEQLRRSKLTQLAVISITQVIMTCDDLYVY